MLCVVIKMGVKMAKVTMGYRKFGEYSEYITDMVISEFGGSYQNRQELRNTWRVTFPYNAEYADFIMLKTKTFLRTLPDDNLRDLNFSYRLCQNIADYLSKYMAKGIENNGNGKNENKKSMNQDVFNQLFFDFDIFVKNFYKRYKKPLDMANDGWVNANPGVVAMAKHLGKIPEQSVANVPEQGHTVKKRRPRIGRVDVAAIIAAQQNEK